jgi:serine/threonine-protein kinase
VLARIEQGGLGLVYLCRQAGAWGFKRLFALRVVQPEALQDEDAVRALLREAEIGGLLAHPNVLGVIEVDDHEGRPFLVMDYVEGASLAELCAGPRPLPAAVVVPVIIDALRGLQAAHELPDSEGRRLGLVHGGISPDNILVGIDGSARITNFASSRISGHPSDSELRPPGARLGFLAPEQLRSGEPVDGRADLFTMGVVMWTALTGRNLFAASSNAQTFENVLRKPIDRPSAFGAPRALDDVCMRALARLRDGRFQTADEMRLALQEVALAEKLVASSAEIGMAVRDAVGETLEERRQLIRSFTAPPAPAGRAAEGQRRSSGTLDQRLTGRRPVDPGPGPSTMVVGSSVGAPGRGTFAGGTRTTDGARVIDVAELKGASRPRTRLVAGTIAGAVVLLTMAVLQMFGVWDRLQLRGRADADEVVAPPAPQAVRPPRPAGLPAEVELAPAANAAPAATIPAAASAGEPRAAAAPAAAPPAAVIPPAAPAPPAAVVPPGLKPGSGRPTFSHRSRRRAAAAAAEEQVRLLEPDMPIVPLPPPSPPAARATQDTEPPAARAVEDPPKAAGSPDTVLPPSADAPP